jgi:hypothetical protein
VNTFCRGRTAKSSWPFLHHVLICCWGEVGGSVILVIIGLKLICCWSFVQLSFKLFGTHIYIFCIIICNNI